METLLEQLKINKPAQAKQTVKIIIPAVAQKVAETEEQTAQAERVAVKTKIIDETQNTNFDRKAFLKGFQMKHIVDNTVPAVTATAMPAAPVPAAPVPAAPVPAAPVTKRIIKKKPKLVIAEGEELPVVVDVPMPAAAAAPAEVPAAAAAAVAAAPAPAPAKKIIIRRTKNPVVGIKEGPLSMLRIGDADIITRLKKKKEGPIIIPASAYYMNNREIFISFMSSLFNKYKKNLAAEAATPATCPSGDSDSNEFSLMTHQQVVRDYLNVYTPYRGLLLYHGLGSGKTCSSIAIAEGMKTSKQVIVMTPASLQVNYREELKKCGDELYRKNQFWEFIPVDDSQLELIETLSQVLSVPVEQIRKNGGAWLVNMTKPSNYDALAAADKLKIDTQLDEMIGHKYKFINYNGLRAKKVLELTKNDTINPFDNAVIIVDEAHNLVSRIVNKLGKKKSSIAITLYNLLMRAKNAKIVLLTGTPIINYPNEIAILFNMLRGYITSWSFKLNILEQRKINGPFLQSLFKSSVLGGNIMDLIEYKSSSTTMVITRNPFGFVNNAAAKDGSYSGVKLEVGERGEISDEKFLELVTNILSKNNIKIQPNGVTKQEYKALPDTLDEFKNFFIEEDGKMKGTNIFKRRILGLNSYFRSAQEGLMPRYAKENPMDFQVIKIPMSDFQFTIYEEARVQERNQEKRNAKKKNVKQKPTDNLYEQTTSTYRIFSRAFCNFVFPKPAITRPMPDRKNAPGEEINLSEAIATEGINEDVLDAVSAEEKKNRDEAFGENDDEDDVAGAPAAAAAAEPSVAYKDRIQLALKRLADDKDKYLTPEALATYSPKFLHILENVQDAAHVGIHLIYSQFRAIEGVGVLKLILEANGYTQFKIKKVGETWELNIADEDIAKPKFALYTGTESTEEKEIVRNVLNSAWKYVPESIQKSIKKIAANNNMGEIIKVFMITSSGAEGISLKSVRYVHITEPYWHPVRIEQVIGRARRICSHQSLPEELRTVTVFLYLMTLSAAQLKSDDTIALRVHDKSRKDDLTPVTTDETLYEIATIKEEISQNILRAVKEVSIDCALHVKSNEKEKLQCFTFGSNDASKAAYGPSINDQASDEMVEKNKKAVTWQAKELEYEGIMYALNKTTNEIYDFDSYKNGNPIKVADLEVVTDKAGKKDFKIVFV